MKRITLILSLLVVCFSWQGNAQILTESFDSATLPSGWTQEYGSDSEDWIPVTENMYGITPHSGTHMAEFKNDNFGSITKLITPSMDLAGVQNPQLNFFFANLKIGVADELRIYYKTSGSGAWIQIGEDYIEGHGDWTEVTLNLPDPTADYFIAFEGSSNWGGGLDLDDVTVAAGPSCLAPTHLKATNLTTTSASVEWTEAGVATNWNIEYGIEGFTPGTGTTVADTDGTLGETISGLTVNTVYDFYVQADCGGGDTSSWSGPMQFATTCEPIASYPWSEDFEGVTIPALPSCWSSANVNGDVDKFETDNGVGVDDSKGVYLYTDFNGGDNDDYLMLPPLSLNGNQQLKYFTFVANGSQPDEYEVLLSTTENDVEDFTEVLLPPTTVSSETPTEVTLDLSAYSGIVHIAVHVPNSSTDGYYIHYDEFSVENITVACPPATNLSATPLGDGSVNLSWDAGSTETEWELEYGAPGFDLGTGTTVTVDNGTPETNLTGLDSNTEYELYVTAICGAEESLPSDPISFRTVNTDECTQVQLSDGKEEAFLIQETSDYIVADDFIISASTVNFSMETITANLFAQGGIATVDIVFYDDDQGQPGAQIGTTIEDVTPTSQQAIGTVGDFDILEVVIDLPNAVDFTRTGPNEAATYWLQISAAPSVPSSPVGWEMTAASSNGSPTAVKYLNDPWLTNRNGFDAVYTINGNCTLVDCPEPTNLTATDITETSAFISWNPIGSETEWELEYGPAGFELGTGTVLTDSDGSIGETISGLEASSYYEYYITPLCGSGDPYPAGPAGFSTLCGSAINTFPFTESFEDTSGTRSCWTNEYVAGVPTDWRYVNTNGNNSIYARTGDKMAQFKIESPVEATKLVSPALDLTTLDNPQLTFYFANTEWIGDVDELRTYYKTSAGGNWIQFGNTYTTVHNEWTQVILQLPDPSSDYYIAFEGKSNFARGMDIDDVLIGEAPSCMQPSDLTATHMTQDSVELSWSEVSGASDGYEWFIFLDGADPLTDTPEATGTTPQGTTTVNVTDLDAYTVYDFYVRSNCGAENSALAGPTGFKTAVIPPACGEKFYDSGQASGDYENSENTTTIISPNNQGEVVTVTFTAFDTDFGWDALYVYDGPDATYPLIDSGNDPTPNFPAGGYYGQTIPGPFTSTHSSGALTFVFRSDFQVTRAGWEANITCTPLSTEDQAFETFSYYPNPVGNAINLKANQEIEHVSVYNLLGQEVFTTKPNSLTPTLEVSNLQTGTYLMKVIIDGNEKAFKLIKE